MTSARDQNPATEEKFDKTNEWSCVPQRRVLEQNAGRFLRHMQHLKERNSTDGGMVGFDKGVLSRDPHQLRNNGTNANTTRRDDGSFVPSRHLFGLKTNTVTDP